MCELLVRDCLGSAQQKAINISYVLSTIPLKSHSRFFLPHMEALVCAKEKKYILRCQFFRSFRFILVHDILDLLLT